MDKIRTFIAHDDEKIKNAIVQTVDSLEFVEIVGTAKDGIETYNKIVELKPEMVFAKYNFNNMTGLDLIRKTKDKLQDEFPVFNTIGEIPDNELMEAVKITGDKLNAAVRKPYDGSAKNIIEEYKEYRNK